TDSIFGRVTSPLRGAPAKASAHIVTTRRLLFGSRRRLQPARREAGRLSGGLRQSCELFLDGRGYAISKHRILQPLDVIFLRKFDLLPNDVPRTVNMCSQGPVDFINFGSFQFDGYAEGVTNRQIRLSDFLAEPFE